MLRLGVASAFVVVTFSAFARGQSFEEHDFSVGSFTTQIEQGGGGGKPIVSQQVTIGNPAPCLSVSIQLDGGPPQDNYCAKWCWPFVLISGAVVDPAAAGGLATLDFALDSKRYTTDHYQSQAFVLLQSGQVFIGGASVTQPVDAWTTSTVLGLSRDMFSLVDSEPPCTFTHPDVHPDFSATGAPIQLGFGRGNSTPCGGLDEGTSQLDYVYADNWTAEVHPTWKDLGFAKLGSFGPPQLTGYGALAPDSSCVLALEHAAVSTSATLVVGLSSAYAPFKGGTLVPAPTVLVGFGTDGNGALTLPFLWPAGVPDGMNIYFQYWIHDPAVSQGLSASNALVGVTT